VTEKEIRRLDSYLYIHLKVILNTKGYSKLKEEVYKILNYEVIDEFYSKEILKLALEKRIILSIEKYNTKSKNPIDLRKINNENIQNYINLFIHEFNNVPLKEEFLSTKEFFDKEIKKAFLKSVNQEITLVNKRNYIDEIEKNFNNLLNKNVIETTYKKHKKSILLSTLISVISMAILTNSSIDIDLEEIEIVDYLDEENIVSDTIFKEETISTSVFLGYDNNCPKEYQEYIYEMSEKYGIPFNIFMCIVDIESDGKFDNNEKLSVTSDYGFCQINIFNHDYIYENLGYTSEDLLLNPYKNIEAAALLLSKICDKYEEEIKQNNPENVFGTYNGWTNWRDKEIAINYATKAMDLYNYVYNKDNSELFETIITKIMKKY
jgi:hypothetical protein